MLWSTRLGRAVAVVAIIGPIAFLGSRPAGPSSAAAHDTSGDFVTRSGQQLLLGGQPYTFTGINLYNANSDGWCREALTDSELANSLLEIGLGAGAWPPGPLPTPQPSPVEVDGHGVIRAWFFQTLAANKTTGAREWARFDRTLQLARDHGYKVIVTLADQWGECGTDVTPTYGYKSSAWYETGYQAPDPGMAAGYPGWKSYREWVEEVVSRYAADRAILMWQLINEAEVNPNGAFQPCPAGDATRDILVSWATDVAGRIRLLDSNHLISLGTIGSGQCGSQGSQFSDVHAIPDIDVCELHDYSENGALPGDPWNGFSLRLQQCAVLDKPVIVGEAGIRPSDVGGSLEDRALAFRAKLVAQRAVGVDGFVAWNYFPGGSTLADYDIGPDDPALLELRSPGSTFLVTTADDPAPGACDAAHCSLREAILAAGAAPGRDLVAFRIPGPGPHVIPVAGPLPAVGDGTFVDGTTEPGTAGSPLVVLDGSAAGSGVNGLVLDGSDAWVRGLRITGFDGSGVVATGAGGRVDWNRIDGNGNDGVTTVAPAEHTSISMNAIVGNGDLGIDVGDDGVTLDPVGGPIGPPPPPEPFRQPRPRDVSANPDTEHVTGFIDGLPGSYRIELFRVAGCDPSAFGEGDNPVAATHVTIAGPGSWTSAAFDVNLGAITDGQVYTATATNAAGTTSELSACALAQGAGPHTYTVTSTAPGFDFVCDADCRFLDALAGAILNPGPDTVDFAIPGTGPHVIALDSELPLEEPIVIDGTTQPGYAGTPLIVFDGTAVDGSGFSLVADSLLRGVAIGGYDAQPYHAAVILNGDRAAIEASYVGLAPDGATPMPNAIGVLVQQGGHATVGGHSDPTDGNVISGNGTGIQVEAPAFEPSIEGNRIGTNAAGTAPVPNGIGIRFVGISGGSVGGPNAGSGNLVSGNLDAGIELGPDSQAIAISANRIGTDATGLVGLGNAIGIRVATGDSPSSTQPNRIGEGVDGNVISGNAVAGIVFEDTSRPSTIVTHSVIGLGADGATPIPNGVGVIAGPGTTHGWLNDVAWESSNVIAANLGPGVLVDPAARGFTIGVNDIHGNGGLGVDLGGDGVTANDALDADGGANRGQNAPRIIQAWDAGGVITVIETEVRTEPNLEVVVLFYATSACDPSGHGEGGRFIGQYGPFTTDAAGVGDFLVGYGAEPMGTGITAMLLGVHAGGTQALDFDVDSSEFSNCAIVGPEGEPTPTGDDVQVTLPAGLGVEITFDNVTTAGVTTADATAGIPETPTGFRLGDPPLTYEITTTAVFAGPIELCFVYDESSFADESSARLLHHDGTGWVDVTSSLDTVGNRICGITTSLSPFAVVERAYVFEGFASPIDGPPIVNRAKAGSAVPVKFALQGGFLGLGIFASGSPASTAATCGSSSFDSLEETVAAGSSSLQYDPVTELYTYVWKTDKSWRGCRTLILTFRDGTQAVAWFDFRK